MFVWTILIPLLLIAAVVGFYLRQRQHAAELEEDPEWDLDTGDDDTEPDEEEEDDDDYDDAEAWRR